MSVILAVKFVLSFGPKVIPWAEFQPTVIHFLLDETALALFVMFQKIGPSASNWHELPAVVDGAVLNVGCVVAMSIVDILVVVSGADNVIITGSATNKGNIHASTMHIHDPKQQTLESNYMPVWRVQFLWSARYLLSNSCENNVHEQNASI